MLKVGIRETRFTAVFSRKPELKLNLSEILSVNIASLGLSVILCQLQLIKFKLDFLKSDFTDKKNINS